jgi:hypothetical protein
VDETAASSRAPLMHVTLADARPPPMAASMAWQDEGTRKRSLSRRSARAKSSEARTGSIVDVGRGEFASRLRKDRSLL